MGNMEQASSLSKREEIREGITDILRRYGNFMGGYDADGDELDIDEALGEIISYLHNNNVVIKLDEQHRRLPAPLHIYSLI